MTVKEHILTLLDGNKGGYISGEEIAGRLSVTRSAVWKAIKSLQMDGYSIQAVTNKGYSLSPHTDILSAGSISKYLDTQGQKLRVEVFKTISSTNEAVKALASNGEAEGKVILSEEQTAGRGRKGRKFFLPGNGYLYEHSAASKTISGRIHSFDDFRRSRCCSCHRKCIW
ncbi:biotin operon repressor [Paenibacillus sonchi]